MTPRAPIEVLLGSDDEMTDAIGSAAARLGAELAFRKSETGRTTVGGVELPSAPEEWRIEAALLRALRPRHVLFLCVANSARSQLAEGIARSLAGGATKISSAGSVPTSVRPQAVAALGEIGIDASSHASKGVDDVERPVDAVITLCAEEVCPVWLENAWRLHWGLPDPAGAGASEEDEMAAFRSVRDELVKRLEVLLGSA